MSCCTTPRPDCMGMLVEGIGNRCQALLAGQTLELGQAGDHADKACLEPIRNDAIRMAEVAARPNDLQGLKQLLPLRLVEDQAQGHACGLAGCADGLQNVADGGGGGVEIVGRVGGLHSAPVVEKCATECRAGGIVSEGTTSAQRILRTIPVLALPSQQATGRDGRVTRCDYVSGGCNYPQGDCLGWCGGGRP